MFNSEILEKLCKELNENCKYKDEYKDRDSWYPNHEWGATSYIKVDIS